MAKKSARCLCRNREASHTRKRWIGFTAQAAGKIHIDDGAAKAIIYEGRSLLAIGIKDVSGQFEKGDVVAIVDGEDEEIARRAGELHRCRSAADSRLPLTSHSRDPRSTTL